MRWFDMPTYLLREMSRNMPRLRAEEALHGVEVAATGAGTLGEQDRKNLLGAWRNLASPHAERPTVSRRAILVRLAGMRGVQVIREPRRTTAEMVEAPA